MKRIFCLLTALVMLCALAACGSNFTYPAPDGNTTVKSMAKVNTEMFSPIAFGESEADEPTETPDKCAHECDEWDTIKEATCKYDGYRTGTCKICGEKFTETLKAEGHELGDWKVTYFPSYNKNGKIQHICTACNKVVEEKEVSYTEYVNTLCSAEGDTEDFTLSDVYLWIYYKNSAYHMDGFIEVTNTGDSNLKITGCDVDFFTCYDEKVGSAELGGERCYTTGIIKPGEKGYFVYGIENEEEFNTFSLHHGYYPKAVIKVERTDEDPVRLELTDTNWTGRVPMAFGHITNNTDSTVNAENIFALYKDIHGRVINVGAYNKGTRLDPGDTASFRFSSFWTPQIRTAYRIEDVELFALEADAAEKKEMVSVTIRSVVPKSATRSFTDNIQDSVKVIGDVTDFEVTDIYVCTLYREYYSHLEGLAGYVAVKNTGNTNLKFDICDVDFYDKAGNFLITTGIDKAHGEEGSYDDIFSTSFYPEVIMPGETGYFVFSDDYSPYWNRVDITNGVIPKVTMRMAETEESVQVFDTSDVTWSGKAGDWPHAEGKVVNNTDSQQVITALALFKDENGRVINFGKCIAVPDSESEDGDVNYVFEPGAEGYFEIEDNGHIWFYQKDTCRYIKSVDILAYSYTP